MLTCAILAALGSIMLVWYIWEKLKSYSLKATILKSLVSVLFLALALCAWYESAADGRPGILGIFVILGLLFGLLGDIWLDLKYVFPQKDEAFTYAGFAVFGAGHVLYITGMLLQYPVGARVGHALVPLLLALLCSAATILLEKPMKLHYGRMKPVAALYGALLFSTLLVAGSLAMLHGWQETTLNLIFLGGILFALSDLILSGTYFGVGKERPVDIILNYLSYYPAQYLIAFSLLFLKA